MSTTTGTQTHTHARAVLLRAQLEVAARRLAPAEATRVIEMMIRPGLSEGFLGRLDFYALDRAGTAHARLALGVDWEQHRAQLTSAAMVRVNTGWQKLAAPEVQVAVELFEETVALTGAEVKVLLIPVPDVDRAALAARFGLSASKRPPWAAQPEPAPFAVRELPELRVELASVRQDELAPAY
ncbi:MAG TPA: hypothetical protein VGE74_31935 [Gemmata sp.]